MVWIDVTIKKNVHVHTYALQTIARFLRQGGHLQSLLRLLCKLAAFYADPPFHQSVR